MHGEGPSLLGVDSLLPSINLSSEKVHSEEVTFVPCGQKQGLPCMHRVDDINSHICGLASATLPWVPVA